MDIIKPESRPGDALPATAAKPSTASRLGLGIDAGGTYTDVVICDFQTDRVLQKVKALTTKWDFTIGISQALDQLDVDVLRQVDLVTLSTTLATNAIVEGRGQPVGLLLMPPYGLFDEEDVFHRPFHVIQGKLEIDGTILAPVNPDQVRRFIHELIDKQGVRAFAVCGYASHVNPAHELEVKELIRQECDLSVTCGHDVSEGLNYRIRAITAVLNGQIIPYLEALIDQVQQVLKQRGIHATLMVVKSDGSLMSAKAARKRPIETLLSGPAASVSGARYLSGLNEAIVLDMGGTTSDTAIIKAGRVQTCDEGAYVGGRQTHVKALDMRTMGLGGDSHITCRHRELRIGPRRVAPFCWLASRSGSWPAALDWIDRRVDKNDSSSGIMDMVSLNVQETPLALDNTEKRIMEALMHGPLSLDELSNRVGIIAWQLLPLERLEENHIIQRCGLTPTDALHATGQLSLWDADAARRVCSIYSRLLGISPEDLTERILRQVVKHMAVELLKMQLADDVDPDDLEHSPTTMAMINNLLNGGGEDYAVSVKLHRPIVGIGAPVHFFLPQAARLLGT
ncbi:MAG: hydantoinase/oxoprolinase family protein [bacterium]